LSFQTLLIRILLVFYKLSTIIYSLCRGKIYKDVGSTWMVSDCEELVGVTHRRWWGRDVNKHF